MFSCVIFIFRSYQFYFNNFLLQVKWLENQIHADPMKFQKKGDEVKELFYTLLQYYF